MERYFDWQVKVGATRHLGGLKATEDLVKSCNISKDKRVLEVGCGVGLTLCYVNKDKLKAMKEYARVVKQGGYVGFNGGTWIKLPPENVRKYLFKLSSMVLETYDKWVKLLVNSGLKVIVTRVYRIKYSDELTR